MDIISKMRKNCLYWLFLVAVDIIRDWLAATSDWIYLFEQVFYWVAVQFTKPHEKYHLGSF